MLGSWPAHHHPPAAPRPVPGSSTGQPCKQHNRWNLHLSDLPTLAQHNAAVSTLVVGPGRFSCLVSDAGANAESQLLQLGKHSNGSRELKNSRDAAPHGRLQRTGGCAPPEAWPAAFSQGEATAPATCSSGKFTKLAVALQHPKALFPLRSAVDLHLLDHAFLGSTNMS